MSNSEKTPGILSGESIRPFLTPLALVPAELHVHVLEQEAEITKKGRTRVTTITENFCKDVRHGKVQTWCSKVCRKVRVSKESKLQTLRREKRKRREKVMEAERALAPSHKIMQGCRK